MRVLSFDCLLLDLGFKGGKDSGGLRLNYVRLIMYNFLPVIIFCISYLFWYTYGSCKKMDKNSRRDRAFATTVIVLFLFYPTIVSVLAQSLNCRQIDDESRLVRDLEEVCY